MACFFENHRHKSIWWIFRCHKKSSDSFCFKNFEDSKLLYENCSSTCELLKQECWKFSNICSERSKICKHWRGVLKLISLLKGCVAAVRECNWEAHFHTIQRLLPVFCILGSINYLRYASWYLEKMRKLSEEYPQLCKHFQEGKCFVKTNAGYSNQLLLTWNFRNQEYLTFRKERYTRMFLVESKNLAKNSKYELSNPLKKLLDTSGCQFDKTEVTVSCCCWLYVSDS